MVSDMSTYTAEQVSQIVKATLEGIVEAIEALPGEMDRDILVHTLRGTIEKAPELLAEAGVK